MKISPLFNYSGCFLNGAAHKTWICDTCSLFAFKYVHLSSSKGAKDNKNTALMALNYRYELFKATTATGEVVCSALVKDQCVRFNHDALPAAPRDISDRCYLTFCSDPKPV